MTLFDRPTPVANEHVSLTGEAMTISLVGVIVGAVVVVVIVVPVITVAVTVTVAVVVRGA